MSQVGAHGVADDRRLGGRPTDAGGEQVVLQPQERAQRQPDVVALRLALRAWQRSTSVHCLIPRWYVSIAQEYSAICCRVRSVIARSLVAQYAMSPSGATILNTLTSP